MPIKNSLEECKTQAPFETIELSQISWIDVHFRHVKSLFNQQIILEDFIHPHIILGLS